MRQPKEIEIPIKVREAEPRRTDWLAINRRRGDLIEKEMNSKISRLEEIELAALQAYTAHFSHLY